MKLTCFFGLFLITAEYTQAQFSNNTSIYIYGKTHIFYDAGVYDVNKANADASAYGLGFSINKPLTKKLTFNTGYGIAVADQLKYDHNYTTNAIFHQLDANMDLKLFKIWKFQPSIFTGYCFNHIQQIDHFGYKNNGMNINLGGALALKIKPNVELGYRLTYGFSLDQSIPYNFRNQFGIILKRNDKSNQSTAANLRATAELERSNTELSVENSFLRTTLDSLNSLNHKSSLPAEIVDKSIIITQNELLLDRLKALEEDNQLLLDELRSKRLFTDSVFKTTLHAYSVINQSGQVIALGASEFPNGYYLYSQGFAGLKDAVDIASLAPFSGLKQVYFLNRNDLFYALFFVSDEKSKALQYFEGLGSDRFLYKLIKI